MGICENENKLEIWDAGITLCELSSAVCALYLCYVHDWLILIERGYQNLRLDLGDDVLRWAVKCSSLYLMYPKCYQILAGSQTQRSL